MPEFYSRKNIGDWEIQMRGLTLLIFRNGELVKTLKRNILMVKGGFLARYNKQWRPVKKVGKLTYRYDEGVD